MLREYLPSLRSGRILAAPAHALAAIGDFIARRDPLAAATFIQTLMDRTRPLQGQPRIGRRVPEMPKDDLWELIHGNYRIVYALVGTEIHIPTVFEVHRLPRLPETPVDELAP